MNKVQSRNILHECIPYFLTVAIFTFGSLFSICINSAYAGVNNYLGTGTDEVICADLVANDINSDFVTVYNVIPDRPSNGYYDVFYRIDLGMHALHYNYGDYNKVTCIFDGNEYYLYR